MDNYDCDINCVVEELISTGREDDWWDFKQCHYNDRAALLHDIICLANNRANKDAYLILGVKDETFEIVGVENDPKRKNQQNIVDFLRIPNFAGQTRPRVEVRTVMINNHEVDVFIIKNSTDVPYYLVEDYTDRNFAKETSKKGKIVKAFHIYTRVMDNNTPIDKNADIRDVEYLWRKRFGLVQTPLEHIKVLLSKPCDWIEENYHYYHKLFPQYTIFVEHEETEDGLSKEGHRMFYHHVQTDTSAYYGTIKISHYGTQLFSCQSTDIDGHRMTVPCPVSEYIPYRSYGDYDIFMKYYIVDSFEYLLLKFFEFHIGEANGHEAQIATHRLFEVVLLFNSKEEVDDFSKYIHRHLGRFDELVEQQKCRVIEDETPKAAEIMAQEICNSEVLLKMQSEWEIFCRQNECF